MINPRQDRRDEPRCLDCGTPIYAYAQRCRVCAGRNVRKPKTIWPPLEQIIQWVNETSYREVARSLGVSDNAVRKRIRRYVTNPPPGIDVSRLPMLVEKQNATPGRFVHFKRKKREHGAFS